MWKIAQSEVDVYDKCIDRALEDEEFFNKFKISDYSKIVGMSSLDQLPYFISVMDQFPIVQEKLPLLKKNDLYGGLELFKYRDAELSVNTCRYLNTSLDIFQRFGPLDNKIIAEIGIGYGGLAFMINTLWNTKAYFMFDQLKPLKLAQKYLYKLEMYSGKIKYGEAYKDQQYYLTISEYAISELDLPETSSYNENMLKNSQHIYLACIIHDRDK